MTRFLFVLSRGPEDATRATRCLHLAKVAADKGHEVHVFLVDEGVYLANLILSERIKAPTGDELMPYIRFLQDKGAVFHVCTPCASARLIAEDDLPKGFILDTSATLIDLAVEAKVLSF